MTEWWHGLLLEKQIFYGIGIVSLALLLFQILLSLIGLDHHSDVGTGVGDHDSGMGLFSLRTVTAFFTGFGWTGGILLNHGYSIFVAIGGGIGVGTVFLLATSFLIVNLLRLQGSGNIDYQNAVGTVGTVYTTIPAAEGGSGQLELVLQGRLMMAEALTKASQPLKPNSKARVIALLSQTTLLVEPLKTPPNA